MNKYKQDIELYFELKGATEASKESYRRRMEAFIAFLQDRNICLETLTETDIQQYILYLKRPLQYSGNISG